MNNLNSHETKKLFYSEYLYKLVFRNSLNSIFRTEHQKGEKLSFVRKELDILHEQKRNGLPLIKKLWRTDTVITDDDYYDAIDLYKILKASEEYKLRIDPNCSITLFSNNKDFLLGLGNKLRTSSVSFWQPNKNHIEFLKNTTKTIIVDTKPALPVKIWFNSNRVNKDFASWIHANSDKCKIGDVALESLEQFGYLNGLYMFVRDEKVLNLVTLLAGHSIRNVEKLVYKDDIDKYMYGTK